MSEARREHWRLTKPAVRGRDGLAASQHTLASELGARVLREGGNAVDAAVAMGLAIGAVEPWGSGLGGGGYMLVHRAADRSTWCVSFPMPAPAGLDPATYPLTGKVAGDTFGWPEVEGERNVKGASAVGVPGLIAGLALALERFGTRSWAASIAPGLALAEAGLTIDWYATLKIAIDAPLLAQFPESRRVFLPGGLAPTSACPPHGLPLGRLAETYRRLAEAGPRDFYEGALARDIAADMAEAGGSLGAEDLARYRATVEPAPAATYRGATVHVAPGLTAGPTLHDALRRLEARWSPKGEPDTAAYTAYADALAEAYAQRFATMGAGEGGSTSHITVADRDGNMVALTQTLLYLFGGGVMLPRTGILMNNAIAWFDPRPGRPNSLGPGKLPLSNMCPTIVERDGAVLALGASGGRRIMPALFQLVSFVIDHGLDVEAAAHQPRIDVSGVEVVVCDPRLGPTIDALAQGRAVAVAEAGVYPASYACPNLIGRAANGDAVGAAFIASPWAAVAAA